MAELDQEFIEYVVKAIVDEPAAVKVERKIDEMGVLLTLAVDPKDMGKVIGKEGNTARALRTLLRVLGAKNNARVNLKILEPEGAEPRPPREPRESREPKERRTREKPAETTMEDMKPVDDASEESATSIV